MPAASGQFSQAVRNTCPCQMVVELYLGISVIRIKPVRQCVLQYQTRRPEHSRWCSLYEGIKFMIRSMGNFFYDQ